MERKYGQSLRDIRKSKNLSLKETAQGVMSNAQLSKFERGDSEITISKLFQILDNINVTMEEFNFVSRNYELRKFDKLLKDMRSYHISNNINMLMKLKEQELAAGRKLNAIMIGSVIHDVSADIQLSKSEKAYLTDYLFSVSEWGYYELVLFSNSVNSMNVNTLIILAKEMLNNSDFYLHLHNNKRMLSQTLINVVKILIDNNEMKSANFLLKKIKALLSDETSLYEKNVYLFLYGYYLYQSGDEEIGKSKMEKSIEIFENLDSSNLAINYASFYKALSHM
jgi:Rgg/GadR/MutR family transcriptional activator